MNVNVKRAHQVAHVHLEPLARSWFEGCCGCGWVGPPQTALLAAVDDVLAHCRPYVPYVYTGRLSDCLCTKMS